MSKKGKMVIFCPRLKKGENVKFFPMMLHDKKAYIGKEI